LISTRATRAEVFLPGREGASAIPEAFCMALGNALQATFCPAVRTLAKDKKDNARHKGLITRNEPPPPLLGLQTLNFSGTYVTGDKWLYRHNLPIRTSSGGVSEDAPRSAAPKIERPPHRKMRGPPGGLIGIDQEVVTLTWPLRRTPGPGANYSPGAPIVIRTRLRAKVRIKPESPAVVRWMLYPQPAKSMRIGSPTKSDRPKSQPPHLVFDSHNYYSQNSSSDHLLSGVTAH
jgi:hypothetical protein